MSRPWIRNVAAVGCVLVAGACVSAAPPRAEVAERDREGWCRHPRGGYLDDANAIRWWLTSSEPDEVAFQRGLGLTRPLSGHVALVTSDSVCARASAAADSTIHQARGRPATVYRVGPLYAVPDPGLATYGSRTMWFFDSTLTKKRGAFGY